MEITIGFGSWFSNGLHLPRRRTIKSTHEANASVMEAIFEGLPALEFSTPYVRYMLNASSGVQTAAPSSQLLGIFLTCQTAPRTGPSGADQAGRFGLRLLFFGARPVAGPWCFWNGFLPFLNFGFACAGFERTSPAGAMMMPLSRLPGRLSCAA